MNDIWPDETAFQWRTPKTNLLMGNFSNWQILLIALILLAVLLFVAVLTRSRMGNGHKKTSLQQRKNTCYEDLTGLIHRYTDLVELLAHEFRYAFNHADQLTPESEEAAEELIVELEKTEAQIREKTNLLSLLNETRLAQSINDFLLKERNKRHASPKDLEKFTATAREQAAVLISQMQQDIQ